MDFDSPDVRVPQKDAEAARRRARAWIIILLVVLLLLLVGVLLNTGAGVTTITQTSTDGQCDFAAKAFNTQQEAFTLAQNVEQYRSAHPTSANYGEGSYTICSSNGTQQRFLSPIEPGFTQTVTPQNATHSEQKVYEWLQGQLMNLSLDFSTVSGIYALIFSQVTVCIPCIKDMISWQAGLRRAAGTNKVVLSIWDIAYGRGFDPTVLPGGPGIPISIGDLRRVKILFTP